MLHFIVDGYNLINKIPALDRLSLQDKRSGLLSILLSLRAHMSSNNKITVVFDGKESIGQGARSYQGIRIIYSKGGGEDADSLIKDMLDKEKNPASAVVVTDDREIIEYSRGKKAQHKSTALFIGDLARKSEKKKEAEFKLPFKDAFSINQELRDIWKKKYS